MAECKGITELTVATNCPVGLRFQNDKSAQYWLIRVEV